MKFLFVLKVLNHVLKVLFRLASPTERKELASLRSDCLVATMEENAKERKDSPKIEEIPYE